MHGALPGLIFIQRIKTWLADTHIQLSIDLFIPISPLPQCLRIKSGGLSFVFYPDTALAALVQLGHIPVYAPSLPSLAALSQDKILRT